MAHAQNCRNPEEPPVFWCTLLRSALSRAPELNQMKEKHCIESQPCILSLEQRACCLSWSLKLEWIIDHTAQCFIFLVTAPDYQLNWALKLDSTVLLHPLCTRAKTQVARWSCKNCRGILQSSTKMHAAARAKVHKTLPFTHIEAYTRLSSVFRHTTPLGSQPRNWSDLHERRLVQFESARC